MTSIKRVREVFYKKTKIKPVKVIKLSEGMINEVFEIQTGKGDYILRVEPSWLDTVERANDVMNVLYEKKIIPNKVITCDTSKKLIKKSYIVYEKLEGNSLMSEEKNLTMKEIDKVLKKAVNTARKISKIKTEKYGWMKKYPKGWAHSEANDLFNTLTDSLLMLKKHKYFPNKTINKINEVFYNNSSLFYYKPPKLVYIDLNFGNIIVKNKRFFGLIDFDGCISGDPLRSYTILYFATYKSKYENMVKRIINLNKHQLLKLKLFSLEFVLRIIASYFKHGQKMRKNYAGLSNKQVVLMLLKEVSC